MLRSAFQLVALTFIRSHVAAARILRIGAWHTTLIRLQQMTVAVGTATRVASINRWAAGEKSLRLCRAAVVLQGAQHRVDVVHITGAVEVAALVATKIVALGGHGAGAVSPRVVCDNAVLKIHGRTVGHSPTRTKCGIPADRAAIDYDNSTVVVVDSAAEARRSSVKNITSSIPSDCTIRNRQLAFIGDPATEGNIAPELGAGEIGQIICDCALADYHRGTCVVVNAAAPSSAKFVASYGTGKVCSNDTIGYLQSANLVYTSAIESRMAIPDGHL